MLDINKTYKTRDGDMVISLQRTHDEEIDDCSVFTYMAQVMYDGNPIWFYYTDEGRAYRDREADIDLIEDTTHVE